MPKDKKNQKINQFIWVTPSLHNNFSAKVHVDDIKCTYTRGYQKVRRPPL